MHRLQELVRLHRLGLGSREVARHLQMGPNTERRYRVAIEKAGLLGGSADELPEAELLKAAVTAHAPPKLPPQQQSSIEKWKPRIEGLLEDGLGPKAIMDRLRLEEEEFGGGLGAIKRMVAALRRERGPQAADVAVPVETAPGDVAQVDFGYVGWRWDSEARRLRKAWVFVMVLGYSRHMYAEITFDQRLETWLRLHVRAFTALGGVPQTVVPDNLKAAVVRAAFGLADEVGLNRSYRELARHYGFKIDPTPARAPKKKGKVESGVKYVKNNALAGRENETLEESNHALVRWVQEIAGQRNHGTTNRRPIEVFEAEEQALLLALPEKRYEPVIWKNASVHRDSHVVFEKRLYSVPWRLMGREVWIRATSASVYIYYEDERVATHRRRGLDVRSTDDNHLPPERTALRHRSRAYWEERADRLGEDVGNFIREVFDSDDVLSQLRQVQGIVTHLEQFPRERAQGACRRALFYGATKYQAIKSILRQALDLDPLPTTTMAATWADTPRFARDPTELAAAAKEVSHERH